MNMRWLGIILQVSRPRVWVYLGGMYAMGFALGAQRLDDLLPWRFWAHLVFFLPLANLLLYGTHALYEHEPTELHDTPETPETFEQRAPVQHRRLIAAGVLIAALVNCVLIRQAHTWYAQLLLGLFLLLAVLNNLPPVRLQARPVLDLLASVLYVLPGFLGYYQTSGHYPAVPVIAAAVCWASGLQLLSAVPDILPDRDAGLRTTAVALGVRMSLLVCALLWSGFALIIVLQGYLVPLGMVAFIYPLLGFFLFEYFALGERASRWFPWLNGAVMGTVIALALARLS